MSLSLALLLLFGDGLSLRVESLHGDMGGLWGFITPGGSDGNEGGGMLAGSLFGTDHFT